MAAPSTPVASSVGTSVGERPIEEAGPCAQRSARSGDLDGDGRPDTVTLTPRGDTLTVRLGTGAIHDVALRSSCPSLVGFADVNSDGREELWWKDGLGNTAHLFDLVAWVDGRPVVVVEPDADNPLVVGWGFSGGAGLWCADADGDGRTDIVRQVFGRDVEGRVEDEREFVYHLQAGRLVRRSEGPPRTRIPEGAMQSLTCGAVAW